VIIPCSSGMSLKGLPQPCMAPDADSSSQSCFGLWGGSCSPLCLYCPCLNILQFTWFFSTCIRLSQCGQLNT